MVGHGRAGGELIFCDKYGAWHHGDDSVICSLDPIQWASPKPTPPEGRIIQKDGEWMFLK